MTAPIARVAKKATFKPHVHLAQGDCLAKLAALPDGSVDLVLTDLPYGTTQCGWDTPIDLDVMWRELYRVGKADCVFVFTAQDPFTTALSASNLGHKRHSLVWEKSNGTCPWQAKLGPLKAHEDILVFCRGRARYNPQMVAGTPYTAPGGNYSGGQAAGIHGARKGGKNAGTRYPRSVQFFAWERGWHPTQKPVALMSWLVRTYSNPGQTVLDLTMGSGTTGIAAVREGRNFIGFELVGSYMAIANRRIQAAQEGLPDPLPPRRRRKAPLETSRKTLRQGKGFGAGRSQKGVRHVR